MGPTFKDHFSTVSQNYAGFRPCYPAAIFDWLASCVPRSGQVWDCATGSGQAAVDLATRFARVIATDASRSQIAAAPPTERVEFRVAPAERSGLPDQSTDLITVAQAVHWFDLEPFYAEVRRVLRPNGVLAIWAYGVQRVEGEAVNQLIQDFYSNIVGPYWPPERRFVEDGYQTLPFPFTPLAAPAFQMEEFWSLEQLIGYLGTWSATTRYMQAHQSDPRIRLSEALKSVWGDPAERRKVSWPVAFRAGKV